MEVVIPHTTILSTNNVENIYTTDLNKTAIMLLKKRYIGKIFKGCFVTDIELIPNRMIALFDDNTLDGYVKHSVSLNLIGLKIFKHDIVADMKTIKIQTAINISNNSGSVVNRDVAILSNPYANCSLMLDGDMQHVKVDDATPVVCTEVNYTPMSEKIAFASVKMIPVPPKFVNVVISFPTTPVADVPSFQLYQKIKIEFYAMPDSKYKSKIIKKMQKVSKIDKKEIKESIDILNLFDIKNSEFINFSRPASIEYASSQILTSTADIKTIDQNSILNGDMVLMQTFHDIAHEMKTVISLMNTNLPDNSKYWGIYAKYRF